MIVYFVRHASAGQHKANPEKDEKRPIDREGVLQAHQVGRLLAALDVEVEVIISSPLKRAMQTASLVANEIGYEQKIERATALRPEATFDSFRRTLADYSNKEAIMVVGHNPSITEFLSMLLSRGEENDLVDFKKGSVVRVQMTGRKSGTLHWCITPKIASAAYEAANPKPNHNGANGTRRAREVRQTPERQIHSRQKAS